MQKNTLNTAVANYFSSAQKLVLDNLCKNATSFAKHYFDTKNIKIDSLKTQKDFFQADKPYLFAR